MATKPKRVPPESLPRRRPSGGGFHPITIHVRVNRDGNYLLSHLPETGGPFRDFRDLQDAVRARYAGIYLSWHRRRRPLLPPPPSTDSIFQFRYVVEERGPQRRHRVPSAPEAAGVLSRKESLNAGSSTATSSSSSSPSSSRRPDQDTVMASPPSMSSRIWARVRPDWGFIYYVRVDLGGSFHTYPHVGGPFQSSEEAERAMDRYLHERQDPTL